MGRIFASPARRTRRSRFSTTEAKLQVPTIVVEAGSSSGSGPCTIEVKDGTTNSPSAAAAATAADRRRGPLSAPRNKVTAEENERLLAIANSPEFRDQSPRQIVPRLAAGISAPEPARRGRPGAGRG